MESYEIVPSGLERPLMAMLIVNGTVPLSLPSVASATGGVQAGDAGNAFPAAVP